jgi:hypothetical protein
MYVGMYLVVVDAHIGLAAAGELKIFSMAI